MQTPKSLGFVTNEGGGLPRIKISKYNTLWQAVNYGNNVYPAG
jgi:hypothetical protein